MGKNHPAKCYSTQSSSRLISHRFFVHFIKIIGQGKFAQFELTRRRNAVDKLRPSLPEGVTEEIIHILDNLEVRIFKPVAQTRGSILYFHGGGFVMCSVSMYRKFLANLALKTSTTVYAVNYRKAPEHPFPSAQLDAFDTAVYLFQNAENFDLDPENVVFAGDSAGGQLAVNCWYRLHHSKYNYRPVGISIVYPALGYSFDTPR